MKHLGVLETEPRGPLAHLDDVSQLGQVPHHLVRHPLAEVVLEGPLHQRSNPREGQGTCKGPQGEVVEAENGGQGEQGAEKPAEEFVKEPIDQKEEPED